MVLVRDFIKNFMFVMGILCFLFLVYSMIYGKSGFLMKKRLDEKVATAQNALYELRHARRKKQQDVSLLRLDNLDVDLLEEQARLLFGVTLKDEFQIIEKKSKTRKESP